MTQTITERLHIVEGSDWKDAVIALLEPKSPYRPWRHGFGEAHVGDPVAVVLSTDPVAVLTKLAYIGDGGDPGCAVIDSPSWGSSVLELNTLAMILGLEHLVFTAWRLEEDAAVKMELALRECRHRDEPDSRFGNTSLAAARTLLHSGGACDGCDNDIDLTGPEARDQVYVHTVDPCRRPNPTPVSISTGTETCSRAMSQSPSILRKPVVRRSQKSVRFPFLNVPHISIEAVPECDVITGPPRSDAGAGGHRARADGSVAGVRCAAAAPALITARCDTVRDGLGRSGPSWRWRCDRGCGGMAVGHQVPVGHLVGQDMPDRDAELVHDGDRGSVLPKVAPDRHGLSTDSGRITRAD